MAFLYLIPLALTVRAQGFMVVTSARRSTLSSLHAVTKPTKTSFEHGISVDSYKHKDWKLTYLFKEAAPGREHDCPIILVHPVGVGISSWFFTKLMTEFTDCPAIYAPDLIGCGLAHGADAWDPETKGMFFPLSWVEGVETLINTVVMPRVRLKGQPALGSGNKDYEKGCVVLVQGGLVSSIALFNLKAASSDF